jgi:hypothetical protein
MSNPTHLPDPETGLMDVEALASPPTSRSTSTSGASTPTLNSSTLHVAPLKSPAEERTLSMKDSMPQMGEKVDELPASKKEFSTAVIPSPPRPAKPQANLSRWMRFQLWFNTYRYDMSFAPSMWS